MRFGLALSIIIWSWAGLCQNADIKDLKKPSDSTEVRKKKRPRKDTSELITQPKRVEIPIKNMNDEIDVVDGYKNGLLVVHNTREQTPNGPLWQFHFVDNNLEVQWQFAQIISERSTFIGHDYHAGFYFLLFESSSGWRDYKIMVIDVRGNKSVFQDFSLPFSMDIQYFEALDNGVLLAGTYGGRPVAIIHDIVGGKPQVLPGFYNYNERIFDVVMDEDSRLFSIVLAERMRNGKYTNRIKTFTFDGLLMMENVINPGEELNLVDGTTSDFGNGIQYMAGTYSTKQSVYSRGIYISKFMQGQQRFLKNYNYGELSNFFSFRGERAAKRLQRKTSRKKARGKEPRFNYRLFIHEIVPKGDVNIMIAEAYYARYSSNGYSPMGYGGMYSSPGTSMYNPYGPGGFYGGRMFLGYKFTHAIIVAFDSKGDIIWDNSFRTNDITSYNLEESVAVNVQGDKAVIMYLDDGLLKSKVIDGNEVVEGKTYNPIKLLNPKDKSKSRNSEINGVKNWYENYLYTFGVQKVKNKSFPRKERVRKVLYINKIQFDEAIREYPDARMTKVIPQGTESVSETD